MHDPPPPPPLTQHAEQPTPVIHLDYEPPLADPRGSAAARWVRRVAFAAGIAFVAGGILMAMFPRDEEVAMSVAFGVGLIALSIPMPKWFNM